VSASVKAQSATRSLLQPTCRQAARARSTSRSAIAATRIAGDVGTCDRNMEPNLPAPITATPIGPLV